MKIGKPANTPIKDSIYSSTHKILFALIDTQTNKKMKDIGYGKIWTPIRITLSVVYSMEFNKDDNQNGNR
jgi:hypothetical protein